MRTAHVLDAETVTEPRRRPSLRLAVAPRRPLHNPRGAAGNIAVGPVLLRAIPTQQQAPFHRHGSILLNSNPCYDPGKWHQRTTRPFRRLPLFCVSFFATALAYRAILLFLDERFGALDRPTREALLHDLQRILHETATAVVFTAHEQDEVTLCIRPEHVTLACGASPGPTSARNVFPGKILRIIPCRLHYRIELDVGCFLVACVTRHSCEEMQLTEGAAVTASFIATAVHLIAR